jgi:transposase InsO family protein
MRVQSLFVEAEGSIMMDKEAQDHELTETATLEGRRETSDYRRGSRNRQHNKRSMPATWDRHWAVLCMGETCPSRSIIGVTEREERTEEVKAGGNAKDRGGETSCGDSRTEHREPGAKKGAMGIVPYRHYSSEEKELILASVERVQEMVGAPVKVVLDHLGIPSSTYYQWQHRKATGSLADRTAGISQRRTWPPIPQEIESVRSYGLEYPQIGYKRLTWQMIDDDVAYLKPYQVYEILKERGLLRWGKNGASETLNRPPEPDHPDEVWHVDLMYLYIHPRWYYLVDIIDGYSRFMVNWSLNLTMESETVTMTVQEALDKLDSRRAGEPRIVHDHGSQFIGHEWRNFVKGAEITDIKTRIAHPESNGRLERLHRTHREEGLTEEALTGYYAALDAMERWNDYYNYKRPHSAIRYLVPADYYRGNPDDRIAERQEKLVQAVESRKAYWQRENVRDQGQILT